MAGKLIQLTARVDDAYVSAGTSIVGNALAKPVLHIPGASYLCFSLVDSDGTAYALPDTGNEEYYLGIDDTYGTHADLASAATAAFNDGTSWGDEDPTAGKIGVEIDVSQASALVTDIGSAAEKEYQAQLLYRPTSGDDWQTLALFPVLVKNRIGDPS